MCSPLHRPGDPLAGAGRRTFLRATALTGAAAGLAGAAAAPAVASTAQNAADNVASWQPDPDSPRFTCVVMPDTQYLFDGASLSDEPVKASLRYILEHGRDENIVFLSHLGDLTEHGLEDEFAPLSAVFGMLDRRRVGYSVLAGNHDIDSRTDDQRGRTPYLDAFGPRRMRRLPTFGGATPDGYNTYHRFRAAGREWLVLALDWRPSAASLAWAKNVIAQHPRTPVILTTHELVYADRYGDEAEFAPHGKHLWDELIADQDQIFLTLNGHYWPAARTVRKNTAGHDVHLHITNYQNRYYGGSGMIRLYRFDLARNTIDVETLSPWILGRDAGELNELERREIEMTGPEDSFSVPLDFDKRFAGFAPVPARGPRPASKLLVPGTVAYWRFDGEHREGTPADPALRVKDLSGHGNDLLRETVPGSPADALRWSGSHHPDQPGHGSLYFDGGKPPLHGAYLRTATNAPSTPRPSGPATRSRRSSSSPPTGTPAVTPGRRSSAGAARSARPERPGRPGRTRRHSLPVRRPRTPVGRRSVEPAHRDHQLEPRARPRDLVAPRRRQRLPAHHDVRRRLPGRPQSGHPHPRPRHPRAALAARRIRVRRHARPAAARMAR